MKKEKKIILFAILILFIGATQFGMLTYGAYLDSQTAQKSFEIMSLQNTINSLLLLTSFSLETMTTSIIIGEPLVDNLGIDENFGLDELETYLKVVHQKQEELKKLQERSSSLIAPSTFFLQLLLLTLIIVFDIILIED